MEKLHLTNTWTNLTYSLRETHRLPWTMVRKPPFVAYRLARYSMIAGACLTMLGACVTTQVKVVSTSEPTTAQNFMAATANPFATEAALEMLREGGSAADAAIAAQMVLTLVEPQSSGIGGGAFMMYFDANTGDIGAYDGRETAPASANPEMFLDAGGAPRDWYDTVVGGLSVGVPGVLRMLEMVHDEHGRLPWKRLFEPAILLARDGFPVSERLNYLSAGDDDLLVFDSTAEYFFDDGGNPHPVGSILTNPALARTLELIANHGADMFYQGQIADDIARTTRAASQNPGGMVAADLGAYEAKKRAPVCLPYRTYLVCGMPPPSSGGITTLQILGILQEFDMAKIAPGSAKSVHLVAEASKLAFADRNVYLADPDFFPPPPGMLDTGYLKLRATEISPTRAMEPAQPGMPGINLGNRLAPDNVDKGLSTTHLSIIDADGNAASMTSSIETQFGSHLMVRGFLLNNQLTDFAFETDRANSPEAGKRPRSSMSPTLVFDETGRVVLAIGSPGGSSIIGYVAQSLIANLDWKLNVQQAINLPHFLNKNGKTRIEAGTALENLKPALVQMGHEVEVRKMVSGLQGVALGKNGYEGGADPRREGVAAGE